MKKQNETIDRLIATRPARAAFLLTLLLLLMQVIPASAKSSGIAPPAPDTLFNCTWSVGPVTPVGLLDAPVVTVGSNMYLFGGVQGGAITANSFRFDGTTWTPIAPLPQGLEFASAVTDGTNCYILGGASTAGTPQTTAYRYNVALNTYTTLAPFTVGTWNHSAVYLNGKIYKWAGTGPGTASANALEIYDVATNTWSAGAAYPLLISFTSGWTQGGFIYSAGGIQSVGSLASAKTYRYDPLTNMWDDAAIADLPATRWGAATAVYDTDAVLAGGYVAGSVTANISPTVISWNSGTSWQTVPDMAGAPSGTHERSRFTGAVLNGSFYGVGGRSIASAAFLGTNSNQKLLCLNTPTNILGGAGSMIVSAGPNGVLDPGETVTVSFAVQNNGGPGVVCTTAALTGTLQATGGVTNPSAPQNYGVVCSPPSPTSRSFTFTVDPNLACGASVTASVQMQDGATDYGTFNFAFVTGTLVPSFSENFDGVVAPALPAGWTTTFSGSGTAATTTTLFPDTPLNAVFLSEAATVGLSEVASATIAIPAGGASRLSFRNLFNTELNFDGLVLEISINGGAFQDILAAGGSFVSGGYTGTLPSTFANPLPLRMAWSGLSGGTAAAPAYITSVVNLPVAASGQNIRLMWRLGSDSSVVPAVNPGVRIDSISIVAPSCEALAPTPLSVVSRKTHGGQGDFDINLPLSGTSGVECRRGQGTGQNDHTIVVTFAAAPTVSGSPQATVTSGTGTIGSNGVPNGGAVTVSGNTVTIPLTNVANAQVLTVTLNGVTVSAVSGNVVIPMGVLLGDTNDSRSVNSGDALQTRGRSGQLTDGTNFRSDVNPDGTIAAGDVLIVRGQSGNSIP